ncbi:MAG: efflux RND transporter periplasmic adaptor subunit [Magnetococcales bacterium]|nr:efflux RND transporter periplasmic adaptor subunit [Magnetococcales bacterium]
MIMVGQAGARPGYRQLVPLLEFEGGPREFWELWTRAARSYLEADLAILYLGSGEGGERGEGRWSILAVAPPLKDGERERLPKLTDSATAELLAEARAQGNALGEARQGGWSLGLVSLNPESVARELVLCVHLSRGAREKVSLPALGLLSLIPILYERRRTELRLERDLARLSEMLEVLGHLLGAERFDQAALLFVNELAERFGCEQVSLSWRSREGLRLAALSHSEKVERRSELTALLEEAGQEAVSQEREILYPGQGKVVTIAHRRYAEVRRPGNLLTLPLTFLDTPMGAVLLERQAMAFTQAEQWVLRLLCDQATRPLRDLESRQRPLYRRLVTEVGASLPRQWRPETPEGRRLAWGLVIVVVIFLGIPIPYRVDASAVIKTDAMAFVGAPFDGYIAAAPVTLGAEVKAGETVLEMVTQELLLEQAGGLADLAQYGREVEKKRAANQLAEMRIAESQYSQTRAKLSQVEYRLSQARVTTPITGVVVEGEPQKNLGGAVKRGETLVKIAAVHDLYAEVRIDERDVYQVAEGQKVSLVLVANPGTTAELQITRVVPSPAVVEGRNVFPVRAEPTSPYPSWWRPGMSGVAKIGVGRRSLIWIATHRLVDFLRLNLWI